MTLPRSPGSTSGSKPAPQRCLIARRRSVTGGEVIYDRSDGRLLALRAATSVAAQRESGRQGGGRSNAGRSGSGAGAGGLPEARRGRGYPNAARW